jgi:acetate kinase
MVSQGEKMKIISVNAGSSSLKFKLFEMPSQHVLCEGVYERIGQPLGLVKFTIDATTKEEVALSDHGVAVHDLLDRLIKQHVVSSLDDITGVGHRVVHGGEAFASSVVITKEVITAIQQVSDLAPLHNPANLTGIKAFQEALPQATQVAVFDTAFHQTMPKEAYMYATPYEWYDKFKVRKYGFHGTSHLYVSRRAAELLRKKPEEVNVVVAHIGNGASLCAVKAGKSVETTMGLTPLAGIPMGTRSGNIDPAIIPFIMEKTSSTVTQVIDQLNKASGLLGVSGVSSDNRDVEKAGAEGSSRAKLSMSLQGKAIADTIAQYIVYMGGADAICFTAGLGENAPRLRADVAQRLSYLGITLDAEQNLIRGEEGKISSSNSKIAVYVIPTNEELVIAEDTYFLSKKL